MEKICNANTKYTEIGGAISILKQIRFVNKEYSSIFHNAEGVNFYLLFFILK